MKTQNLKPMRLFAILLILGLFSCESDKDLLTDPILEEIEIPKTIIEKLDQAGFYTGDGISKFEDGYIIENDIYLTTQQIMELPALDSQKKGSEKQYRTNNLVAGNRTLSVYMDTSFGSYMQNAFNDALRRYNANNLRLRFVRTNNASNNDIQIIAFFQQSNVLGISAGFPQNGNPARTIRLNTRFYNNNTSRPDAATTIAHEIGHAIGFRHTDFMNRSFSCGGAPINEGNAGVGANQINGTPSGPVANSWMLACSSNTNRPFTLSDQIALYNTYGRNITGALLFRYWNSSRGNHFYTTNYNELGDGRSGYRSEGIQCRILTSQVAGSRPLYRYYNGSSVDHFYTANFSELGNGAGGYNYEGIAGYVYSTTANGRIPLYRYWNPSITDHFYTTNFSELGNGGNGWIYEGITGYVLPR